MSFFFKYLLERYFGQGPFQLISKFDKIRLSNWELRNKIRVSIDN